MTAHDIAPAPLVSDNPFRVPAFRLVWLARVAAVLGVQTQSAAVLWQVYEIARRGHGVAESALWLSLVGLVQFLPLFALTLPAGEAADRHDRKLVMGLCIAVEALCAAAFLGLAIHGSPPLWALLGVAAMFGASRAYLAPSSQALVPMLVSREALPRAIVANSLAFQVGAIAGPALGGLIVGVSVALAYGVALGLFVLAAVLVLCVRAHTKPVVQPGSRWALMVEGLSYVWRTKVVFGAISLDLVAVLLGGATLLVPVFAKDVLHVGPEGFGIMRAAFGAGALATALWLSRFPILRSGGAWMFGSVAVFGLGTVVFGLSRELWLSAAALAVAGAADMISVNIRQTLIQIATPDSMRGRVSAVSMLFIGASNELGEFESGLAARFLGPVGAAVFGGLGSLATTGLWAWWFPDLRKADKLV
ncbi:MFS transporter [Caulobacter sp. 17J80-11]|uniref:MFS transporter n=1 Tax=Caulobacter sp. 17J80-11 TaxID=2763502 RepID=UPI00165360AB|nr:MFS transporter [Caulobacter sp. 17J80-11]